MTDDLETRVEWDTAYVNDLPDSAFAIVLPGGEKDSEGKTVPRDLRKLPHHNAEGSLDLPHLRNALSREPQTDMPESDHQRAQAHLEGHARSEDVGQRAAEEVVTEAIAADLEVRDAAKREITARIMPWNTVVETRDGLEMFERGAFDGVDPRSVVLRMDHTNPAAGRGIDIEQRDDAAYMTLRASKTARGDEILTLAVDEVTRGVSVGFAPLPGGTEVRTINGRRVNVRRRVDLREVSTTWMPSYPRAAILAVRSEEEGDASMTEHQEAPVVGAAPAPSVDLTPVTTSISTLESRVAEFAAQLEERSRAEFTIPAGTSEDEVRAKRGEWMSAVMRMLSGERVNDLQMRALADLVTTDNVGVVPDAFLNEIIGVIDPSRPFLNSTRRLDLPPAGMSLVVPKIITRPTAGKQSIYGDESYPEKSEIASTATSITNVTFDAITIAGGGDISLQLLKRSSPSYLSLFLELLAEAYGTNAEDEALDLLFATVGAPDGVNDGGVLDPENLILGPAWTSGAAVKKPINTIWMGSTAVSAFIDAKASGTNAPLYSQIQSGFTAGAGPAGTISGLRPVYVPEIDSTSYDVLVGPSSGFGWTEDGTYTLQVDVPAKAGRDVALVGILWFAPMYPTAFTAYTIAS